jgi:drug/metabolite transporter (DMT)-like permease
MPPRCGMAGRIMRTAIRQHRPGAGPPHHRIRGDMHQARPLPAASGVPAAVDAARHPEPAESKALDVTGGRVERSGDRLKAIGLMVAAVSLFSCLDATAKYLATHAKLPLVEVVWVRFLGQTVVILLTLGLVSVPRLLRSAKPRHQLLRSGLLLCSTAFNFLALQHLRLDQTLSIQFLAPLVVALLAGPLLGEWVGWRRLLAIMVGFCGILIIVRPGYQTLSIGMVYASLCMLCYAGFSLITRYVANQDPPDVTLFYSLLVGTLCVAPFALMQWVWPSSWLILLLMLSMGLWGAIGHYLFIVAYQLAPASSVAPFIYLQLLSMTGLGYFVFGDLPDLWTLAGASVVIGSGIYLVHRENVTRKQAAAVVNGSGKPPATRAAVAHRPAASAA